MAQLTCPHLERAAYTISRLLPTDTERLQSLFERCADFFVMTNGVPAAPAAAAEEFADVPDGKTPQDIDAFGLLNDRNRLIGTLISVKHYPDNQTWWIGLMLLSPEYRGQGLGADFYRTFERWVAAQGGRCISLCAIAPNIAGRQFWQRMGFAEIRKTPPRPYGTKTHEVYVYRREIAPNSDSVAKGLVHENSRSGSL